MINNDILLEILNDWNFWRKKIDTGTKRGAYISEIQKHFDLDMIVTLYGLRRSGKSTLMLQFAEHLIQNKHINPEDILYVNFEDSRFLGEYSLELLEKIYEVYLSNLKPKKTPIVLLDEIQNIKGWEKFVNSLYERKAAKVLVSGSNSALLESDYSTVITGRQVAMPVYPLSFREFLAFKKLDPKDKLEIIKQKNKIKKYFEEYLRFGGLPKAVLANEKEGKEIILRNYFQDILNRDLINRFKIREIEKLELLSKFYLTNVGSFISFNSVQKFTKVPLTTIERFSDYFTRPYLFYFMNRFSYSLKEQSVNPKKVYAADIGLRNAISSNFSEDRGKLLENLVFLNLIWKKQEVYYYRTKNNQEVDFMIMESQKKKTLMQVCARLDNFKTKDREIKSLTAAMKELGLEKGLILTEDEENVIKDSKMIIKVKPVWKWMLE